MKFANLVLQSPIIRSRHDLLPAAGRDQAALRHQPTPGEQLVWGTAMPTSHQAHRHIRLEGLFDHANLLRGRPAPTTLNRRDDLNAIGRIVSWRPCPVSSGAISIGAAGTATDRTKVGLPLRDRRRKSQLAAGGTPGVWRPPLFG